MLYKLMINRRINLSEKRECNFIPLFSVFDPGKYEKGASFFQFSEY